jgi:hypothetical protein
MQLLFYHFEHYIYIYLHDEQYSNYYHMLRIVLITK